MKCSVCPRNCSAERSIKHGVCGVGEGFKVARAAPHFWEEPCISGEKGSGTVFFSGCNLGCVYCQNYEVSHAAFGKEVSEAELVKIFDLLIEKGVHNLNLVTPTHYAPMLDKIRLLYDREPLSKEVLAPMLKKITSELIFDLVFDKAAGIITGKLDEEARKVLKKVINEEVHREDMILFENVDFVHHTPMTVLPVGVLCEIDCEKAEFRILESGVRE